MEALKQYIKSNIIFDKHDDATGDEFGEDLFDELDRMGIYHADNKAFFDIDPETVLHLATMEHFIIDYQTTIDDISREAMHNLAFNYMYSELKNIYLEAYDNGSEGENEQ